MNTKYGATNSNDSTEIEDQETLDNEIVLRYCAIIQSSRDWLYSCTICNLVNLSHAMAQNENCLAYYEILKLPSFDVTFC